MAAGGIAGPALWTLQEALVQNAGDLGRRRAFGGVADSQTLELHAVVRAGLGETAVCLFLKNKTKTTTLNAYFMILPPKEVRRVEREPKKPT